MIADSLFIQPPGIVRILYPEAVWRIKDRGKQVFLTFDDGPIPEVTPWIIGLLEKKAIKATFFCVGENVQKYPSVFKLITEKGHSTGNHTFNHLQGLKTKNKDFFRNIEKADRFIDSRLFRPPHGLMTFTQYNYLKNHFRIIMWDLLSCDTEPGITAPKVMKQVSSCVRPGSIITFHDSVKSYRILKEVLPEIIENLKNEGYSFGLIDHEE